MKTQKQNEPQLSAEMEKRFDGEFNHYSGDEYNDACPMALDHDGTAKCVCQLKWIKHFLATALEEQRAEILNEIENWLVDETGYSAFGGDAADYKSVMQTGYYQGRNRLRKELRAKLAQMKGKDSTSLKKQSVDDLVPDSMKEDW